MPFLQIIIHHHLSKQPDWTSENDGFQAEIWNLENFEKNVDSFPEYILQDYQHNAKHAPSEDVLNKACRMQKLLNTHVLLSTNTSCFWAQL